MSLNYQGYEVNSLIFMSIAMFGGLHVDLAALKTAENIRESSGSAGELVQSDITPTRRAH